MTKKNYSILWKNAKKYILGGNMLLSKRPEMFLPNLWPTYFSKAQKINVWDLNGKKYKDFVFAVGQSTLGYANSTIDSKVKKAITRGNMTTLNCHEEVELAKKLIKLHSWADKVKFARSVSLNFSLDALDWNNTHRVGSFKSFLPKNTFKSFRSAQT